MRGGKHVQRVNKDVKKKMQSTDRTPSQTGMVLSGETDARGYFVLCAVPHRRTVNVAVKLQMMFF